MVISCSLRHDRFLDQYQTIAKAGYGLELICIALTSSEKLQKWQIENRDKIREATAELEVPLSYHGYFYDVDIGFTDEHIREYSLNTLLSELEFCNYIGAKECIIHNALKPGIVDLYYDYWIEKYYHSLEVLLERAEKLGVTICLENMWDKNIEFTKALLHKFNSPRLKLCVDIGHINAFGDKNFEVWLQEFGDRIAVFHLNDNHGNSDEHLPIGEGTIDYKKFFEAYKKFGLNSRLNIETYEDLEKFYNSLSWMDQNGIEI